MLRKRSAAGCFRGRAGQNEAGNIAPLIAEIAAALGGPRFEIVYVNDGSTDAHRSGTGRA